MMADPTEQFDVVVIGGGPAGAATATLIARAGHTVRLFERQSFPRFHVGESLVPACNLTLEKLGVLDRMDPIGFPRKHGVQFYTPSGPSRPFYFSEMDDARLHSTWQVLRSKFDMMLLDTAKSAGVQTSMDTEVIDVITDGDAVAGVRVRSLDESEHEVRARIVIDATGQQGIIAKRFGGRMQIDGLTNTAVYAHYRGVRLDDGIDAGSTLIYRLDAKSWIWFIPLIDTVSIGLVTAARDILQFGRDRAEILDHAIAQSPHLAERLQHAERSTEVRVARDYSYRAARDGGPGWSLCGDALGFIDPVYSTGLLLSLLSAEVTAEAVEAALASQSAQPDMHGFSTRYQTAFDQFLVLVRAFYTDDFRFGELAKEEHHRRGLVDLLTGVVGTPESDGVTNAIREFFDARVANG